MFQTGCYHRLAIPVGLVSRDRRLIGRWRSTRRIVLLLQWLLIPSPLSATLLVQTASMPLVLLCSVVVSFELIVTVASGVKVQVFSLDVRSPLILLCRNLSGVLYISLSFSVHRLHISLWTKVPMLLHLALASVRVLRLQGHPDDATYQGTDRTPSAASPTDATPATVPGAIAARASATTASRTAKAIVGPKYVSVAVAIAGIRIVITSRLTHSCADDRSDGSSGTVASSTAHVGG